MSEASYVLAAVGELAELAELSDLGAAFAGGLSSRLKALLKTHSIVMATAATAELAPAPIPADWILSGTPEARNKELAKSQDRTTYIMVWSCTAGRFNWHYSEDETLVVTAGEAFITNEKGEERRLGPGDMGFFPAGTSCIWRIATHVRKVAVVRHTLPGPLAFGLRVWNRLLRTVRPNRRSPLMRPA